MSLYPAYNLQVLISLSHSILKLMVHTKRNESLETRHTHTHDTRKPQLFCPLDTETERKSNLRCTALLTCSDSEVRLLRRSSRAGRSVVASTASRTIFIHSPRSSVNTVICTHTGEGRRQQASCLRGIMSPTAFNCNASRYLLHPSTDSLRNAQLPFLGGTADTQCVDACVCMRASVYERMETSWGAE